MEDAQRISLAQRIRMWIESVFMARLVPKDRVGPVLRPVFRAPLFFQRLGLGALIPRNVLILTTTGRHSGRPHQTPVEFGPGPRPGSVLVMSGWDGHTDWYRNARRDPCVHVWLHGKQWDALAEPVPDVEVADMLRSLAKVSPAANRMWSRWAGVEMDGTDASYLAAAPHFPSLYLVPAAGGPAQERTVTLNMEDRRRAALALLQQTRLATRALLSTIDPERTVHTDDRAWRVRDVIGHLAAWNAEAARSLEAYAGGGEYIVVNGRGKYFDYNGVAAAARSIWSMEQVWAEYEAAHDQLRQIVAHMPAEKWDGSVLYPWNEWGTVEGLVRIMMKHETTDHCQLVERTVPA